MLPRTEISGCGTGQSSFTVCPSERLWALEGGVWIVRARGAACSVLGPGSNRMLFLPSYSLLITRLWWMPVRFRLSITVKMRGDCTGETRRETGESENLRGAHGSRRVPAGSCRQAWKCGGFELPKEGHCLEGVFRRQWKKASRSLALCCFSGRLMGSTQNQPCLVSAGQGVAGVIDHVSSQWSSRADLNLGESTALSATCARYSSG